MIRSINRINYIISNISHNEKRDQTKYQIKMAAPELIEQEIMINVH